LPARGGSWGICSLFARRWRYRPDWWEAETWDNRKAIEKLRPGLIDVDSKGTPTELTKADATLTYSAKQDTPEWELRFHFNDHKVFSQFSTFLKEFCLPVLNNSRVPLPQFIATLFSQRTLFETLQLWVAAITVLLFVTL
jgi:hypothetical protein